MKTDEIVARLLREPQWTQFQLYDLFGARSSLVLAGRVNSITIGAYNRLACGREKIYRAMNDRWELLCPNDKPFLVPGSIDRLSASLSAEGTIDIMSTHPKETTYVIFFKESDPSEGTRHAEGEFTKLDLTAIGAIAVPEVVTPSPDDDIPF